MEIGFSVLELDVLYKSGHKLSSSKGSSSFICGGEFLDLKPYDLFVVDSVPFRK